MKYCFFLQLISSILGKFRIEYNLILFSLQTKPIKNLVVIRRISTIEKGKNLRKSQHLVEGSKAKVIKMLHLNKRIINPEDLENQSRNPNPTILSRALPKMKNKIKIKVSQGIILLLLQWWIK